MLPAVPPKAVKYIVVVLVGSTVPLILSVKVAKPSFSDTTTEADWKPTPTANVHKV